MSSIRGWAPPSPSPRRPATSRSPGRGPLGVTNCLNYGDPTRPEAFWQLTEGVRGLARRLPRARPARHRRQRVALQRVADRLDRADPRDRRRRAARRRRLARRPGLREGARRDPPGRRGDAGPGRVRVRRARGRRRRRPAGPRPGPRGGAAGVHPRGDRARPRRLGAGRLGRRAGRRHRRGRDVGRPRRRHPRRGRALAGGRPLRREPVAPRRDLPAPVRAGDRAARPAARPPGRVDRDRRRRPARHRARRDRRHRIAAEERGSRIADALEVPLADLRHAWEHGLARALGWEG